MAKAAKKSAPAPRPPAEPPKPDDAAERARMLQLYFDFLGRVFRAVTTWVTHKHKHVRVLGWITWLVLLLVPLGALIVVVVMVLPRWHPIEVITALGVTSGLSFGADFLRSRRRRSK